MDTRFFEFDGIKSHEMGVHIVRVEESRGQVPLWAESSVDSDDMIKRNYQTSFRLDREVLEFNFVITLMNKDGELIPWTPKTKSQISKWLIHNEFKELRFGHDPNKLYYALVTSASPITTGCEDGYMEITMTTNSAYGWTSVIIDEYDMSEKQKTNFVIDGIQLPSTGFYYPQLEVQMIDGEEFKIVNVKDRNRETIVEDLLKNENFFIDNEFKIIKSGVPQRNLFKRFNRNWFRILPGENEIEVYGKCILRIKTQYPIL